MVEDVARVVDVEEVLRRLHDGRLQVVLEVRQHVLQKVGVRLHVGVEDDDHVVVARHLLGEDVELEAVIDVARLATDGGEW